MKYTTPLLASMAAVASAQRNLAASLAEKWNLTEPTFAFDANTFSLAFPVTNFIVDGQAQYSLWTSPNCKSDNGKQLDQSGVFSAKSLTPNDALLDGEQLDSGDFTGRQAQINITINPQNISSQAAITDGIYSQQEVNNQQIATVKFCVRFGLWTTAEMNVQTPVEVNFLETLLTLFVDLTDGFKIGAIEVEPKDRLERTANQAYEVSGYECSADSNEPLDAGDRDRARNQGEIIHVCVTPEAEAKADGIFMRSIDDFAWTREGTIRQAAIEDNRQSGNLLTSYDHLACEGSEVCKFSTILFAQFYAARGQVNGEGVASMQFGNAKTEATRRQLRADRHLQEEGAGAAEFELDFEVNQAEARTGSGAGSLSMGIAAFAAVAASML